MKSLIALLALTSISVFAVETGTKAPEFTAQGLTGNVSLSSYKGKVVVLEWLNHGCPFVKKHYFSRSMQNLQKTYTDKGVVWLSVISSAPGKQGHADVKLARQDKEKFRSHATNILLDPNGTVGKLFEAKTTPHMYIIDKDGILVYQGAIDNKPDTDKGSISGAKNFVAEALDQHLAGKPISIKTTKPYGCSVKYK